MFSLYAMLDYESGNRAPLPEQPIACQNMAMQVLRRRWNFLALVLAYVIAFQGILAGASTLHAAAMRSDQTGQLCRTLAGSADPSVIDHDADQCVVICVSGACSQATPLFQPVESSSLGLSRAERALVGEISTADLDERAVTPSARGPPTSSL